MLRPGHESGLDGIPSTKPKRETQNDTRLRYQKLGKTYQNIKQNVNNLKHKLTTWIKEVFLMEKQKLPEMSDNTYFKTQNILEDHDQIFELELVTASITHTNSTTWEELRDSYLNTTKLLKKQRDIAVRLAEGDKEIELKNIIPLQKDMENTSYTLIMIGTMIKILYTELRTKEAWACIYQPYYSAFTRLKQFSVAPELKHLSKHAINRSPGKCQVSMLFFVEDKRYMGIWEEWESERRGWETRRNKRDDIVSREKTKMNNLLRLSQLKETTITPVTAKETQTQLEEWLSCTQDTEGSKASFICLKKEAEAIHQAMIQEFVTIKENIDEAIEVRDQGTADEKNPGNIRQESMPYPIPQHTIATANWILTGSTTGNWPIQNSSEETPNILIEESGSINSNGSIKNVQ